MIVILVHGMSYNVILKVLSRFGLSSLSHQYSNQCSKLYSGETSSLLSILRVSSLSFHKQVGIILELVGNGIEAESFFLWGKSISCLQSLPLFIVAFSSVLGLEFNLYKFLIINACLTIFYSLRKEHIC